MRNPRSVHGPSRRLRHQQPRGTPNYKNEVANVIRPLLDDLADLLLLVGITPHEFSRLAKISFISAAARSSKLGNGRVNASRVAALTGITRPEVRDILKSAVNPLSAHVTASPLNRVLEGWSNDRDFCSARGKPKVLALRGSGHSFTELIHRYSGDIPAKAVQSELLRLSAIRIKGSKVFHNPRAALADNRALSALLQVSNFLAPILKSASQIAASRNRLTTRTIKLEVRNSVDLNLVQKRAEEILTSTAAALQSLGDSRGEYDSARTGAEDSSQILVSIAVRAISGSRNRPK